MGYLYADQLHNVVIDILKSRELNFNSLHREVNEVFQINKIATNGKGGMMRKGRKIKDLSNHKSSPNNLSKSLKKLVNDGYVKKVNKHSGRTIQEKWYSLTEKGLKSLQLQVLHKGENQDEFKRIYKKILLNDPQQNEVIMDSDQKFDAFLEKLWVKKSDITWGTVEFADTPQIALFVHPEMYPPGTVSRSRLNHVYKEIWDGHKVESTVLYAIFFCYPLEYDPDFRITRYEIWQMNRNGDNKLLKLEYSYMTPGISREDLIRDEDEKKIDQALGKLEENKLIKVSSFAGEKRYVVSDDDLSKLLETIPEFLEGFKHYLSHKMEYFDEPSETEARIMDGIIGKDQFKRMRRELELKRYEHKRDMRKCEGLEEYRDFLLENGESSLLLPDIDHFIQPYTKSKKPITKKDKKEQLQKYYNFEKEKSYNYLKRIPINLEEEGIEEMRLDYEYVIEKYSFLKEIIDPTLPMLFGRPDTELRKAIIEDNLALICGKDQYDPKVDVVDEVGQIEFEKGPGPLRGANLKLKDDGDVDVAYSEINMFNTPFRKVKIRNSKTEELKEIKVYRY